MFSHVINKHIPRKLRDSNTKRSSVSNPAIPESILRQARKNADRRRKLVDRNRGLPEGDEVLTYKAPSSSWLWLEQLSPFKIAATWIIFWLKLPRRIWAFFIDALLIPSYRPEWGEYSAWSTSGCKITHQKIKRHLKLFLLDNEHFVTEDQILHPEHDWRRCQIITIIVSGREFQTQLRTVDLFPNTLLGDPDRRDRYYDPLKKAYIFDRNPSAFESILYYYQSGGAMYSPSSVRFSVMQEEIKFYDLGPDAMTTFRESSGFFEKEDQLPKNLYQRKLWLFIDNPASSRHATLVALFSIFAIILSIVVYCLDTTHIFELYEFGSDLTDPFYFTETICIMWFCMEFILRVVLCPNKLSFFKGVMNIIDLLSILPYFLHFVVVYFKGDATEIDRTMSLQAIRVVRLTRVVRILKLSRYFRGLIVLGQTLRASLRELGLLVYFLAMGVLLFSSLVYFSEVDHENTQFRSILDGLWWAVITMTTVGYGDVLPVTLWGKILGTFCAVAGVLVVALPVPIIVSNFNFFYHNEFRKDKNNTISDEKPKDTSCPHLPTCRRLHHADWDGKGSAWSKVHETQNKSSRRK